MKRVFLPIVLFALASCQSDKAPEPKVASTSSNDTASVNYPLPVQHSATWEVGDPQNSITILNLGLEWSAGKFEGFKTGLADSVTCYLANGNMISGSRDSVIATFMELRKMYSKIDYETHSVVSLKHRDTKENWVCVWAKEITTTTQGKTDSVEIQESWRMNNAGQAEEVYQYVATIKPQKK
jgi:hypothetical protein